MIAEILVSKQKEKALIWQNVGFNPGAKGELTDNFNGTTCKLDEGGNIWRQHL